MLKISKQKEHLPSKIWGFDVETNPDGSFAFGYAVLNKEQKNYFQKKENEEVFFDTKESAIKWLSQQKNEKTIVTGMNLAYDFNSLFPEFNIKRILNQGRFISLDFENKQGHRSRYIKVIDISNFIQQKSLKQISEDFGYKYIDVHDISHPDIKKACFSHAESSAKIVSYISDCAENFGVELRLTAPSTAMAIFKSKFLREGHQIWDTNHEKEEIEQMKVNSLKTYHGAASEVFKKGMKEITMVDVVSMYPFCMKNPLPDMNKFKVLSEEDMKMFHEKKMIYSHEGMAFCSMDIPDMLIPPFIYQSFYKKNLSKIGHFEGWLNFPDIRYCMENGCQIEFGQTYIFNRVYDFFSDYVNYFFELKKKKESKQFAKLMMNSLYGKTGQKPHKENNYIDFDDEVEIDIEKAFEVEGNVFRYEDHSFERIQSEEIEFPSFSYPLIASYITSYARIYLHQTMKVQGFENIVYCDTDSIAYEGDTKIKTGKDLGNFEIKFEGKIECERPKMYRYQEKGKDWEYVIKGIPKRYAKSFWENGYKVEISRPRKFFTAIRTGKKINEWVKFIFRANPCMQKRVFHNNGNSRPYTDKDKPYIC